LPTPIDRPARERRQSDRHAQPRVPLGRVGPVRFDLEVTMDGPAYADSVLGRKVAPCVALAAVALYWHGLGLVMVVGMTN